MYVPGNVPDNPGQIPSFLNGELAEISRSTRLVYSLTAEQIASPSPAILANVDAIYRLNVAPYIRYQSTGTELSPVASSSGGAFSTITGDPADNAALAAELNAKADLVGGTVPLSQLPSSVIGSSVTVRVVTLANVTIATALNNGDSIDGVTLATGNLVLVANQTSKAENGVYVVGAVPARSTSYDTFDEHVGLLAVVSEGTTKAGSVWQFTVNPGGTLNTTDLTVTQTSLQGALLASNNLSDVTAATARTNLGCGDAATKTTGVAASGDLPTRANGDARWIRWFSGGLPAGSTGADGDYGFLSDKPERGTLILKTAGTWAKLDKTYTWAARPSAASYPGEVITISDWTTDFFSDGTNWIPVGKRVRLGALPADSHTGGTSLEVQYSMTIPAGLVIANCDVITYGQWKFTGTAGTKTWRTRIASGSTIGAVASAASDLFARPMPSFTVISPAGPHDASAGGNNVSGGEDGSAGSTITADFTAAVSIEWCITLANAADTSLLQKAAWEIVFP
jgi:hypothetical protein